MDGSPDVTVARKTWNKESRWDLGGGGTAWDSMVYDPTLNLLYVGVGNGMPHPYGRAAPAAGIIYIFTSIVALDAATGRLRWYYQTTPADSYDYTATLSCPPTPLTHDALHSALDVVMHRCHNGWGESGGISE